MAHDPDEDRIRRKAHELWEAEGHPHGRDQDHWDQAREIIAIEDSQASTLLPRDTGAQEPIEPRQAVENYGDVPNLTDQGEHPLTDTSREPAWTSPTLTPRSTGDTVGAVARPAETPTPDIFDGDKRHATPEARTGHDEAFGYRLKSRRSPQVCTAGGRQGRRGEQEAAHPAEQDAIRLRPSTDG